ncbi:MAG: class I SAM-dependent methyltransferase [Candidatus Tectimicrobiota bacterium]
MQNTIQSIAAELQAVVVQEEALQHETNFVARVQALDTLAFRILERIENVQYVHGYQAALARLSQQAEQLWQRLHAVNTQLFQQLRARLVASTAPATVVTQLCDTYVGPAAPAPGWEDIEADYLDVFLNGLLGIDCAPPETVPLQAGMIGYHPTPARVILACIAQLPWQPADVFYDLGAGLGRVALLVGLLTPARVRGIEFEPAYCAYAQQRAAELHLTRVSFLRGDARQIEYADGTVFFLYTPFTGAILRQVLARLQAVAALHPIVLATYGACTRDVAQQPWVQLCAEQRFAHETLSLFRSVR